ncbi:EH domain-binding protein 1-like protein 1 isoform X1 [Nematostella vectensis]|uniref:EH domain-binding protein 1-like protein 1 isoform X1 n=2 Tax=Nematostella vectensis TaxID=45351 RepID=UPI002076EBCB|nr:EH domain-binding protein 1-like protein 1 isoform X1 [Nematostella vectensis]
MNSKSQRAMRGVKKTIARQLKGKFACKLRFTVTYEYVDLQCHDAWKPKDVNVVWFRSHRSKTSQKPSVKASYVDPMSGLFIYNAVWMPPNAVELVVTLYKDSAGSFKKKEYFFVIESHGSEADRKKLALFSCNMADFASPDTNEFDLEMEFKPQSKKVSVAKLGAKIRCEFIKQGNADEDDMESNFSHMSEGDFKQRMSELAEISDDEDDKKADMAKIRDRSRHTWSQFIDEMKTLEYKEYHVAMMGNPLADFHEQANEMEKNQEKENQDEEETGVSLDSPIPESILSQRKAKKRVLSAVFETVPEEDEPPEESPASPTDQLKFIFPSKQLTKVSRSNTLPESIEGSHRVQEWLSDVNEKVQDVKYMKLERENQELRDSNKVLGNEIIQLHKEKDELQVEISELQMLVEDLRTKLTQAESISGKKKKEIDDIRKKVEEKSVSEAPKLKVSQVRGWLCKRGVRGLTGRRWRRRWFATDNEGRLYYYKKTNNTHPRGFIDLDIIVAVQDKPTDEQDTNNALFDVITPARVFELMAHDEEEKVRWINALDYLRHWRSRMVKMTNT